MQAIVTLCIGQEFKLGQVTHPMLQNYAHRVGADFIVIAEPKINLGNHNFEKYQIYELLEKYQRIIYIDTDIIITPQCPNLFQIVPENMFGAFIVSDYTYFHDGAIKKIQAKLGDIGWKRKYFNAGVMVISQCHRGIFSPEHGLLKWSDESGAFYDQTLLNYTIQKLNIPIYDIGYQFNHTTDVKNSKYRFGRRVNQVIKLAEKVLNSVSKRYARYQHQKLKDEAYIVHYRGKKLSRHRYNSYIIHYTGKGHRKQGNKLEQIEKDLLLMQNKPMSIATQLLPFINN